MKTEIIAVGTELLTGQIVNSNAQFLSEKLAEIGVDVYYHTTVGDNPARLQAVFEIAQSRSDVIIVSGGLGPTDDDLTKQTIAESLGQSLLSDPRGQAKINQRFIDMGREKTPNNDRQALYFGEALPNRTGLAVGSYLESEGKIYVLLPGPPSELKPMVVEELLPRLAHGARLYSRVLRFVGMGESLLTTLLADVIAQQTDPTLAPYAKTGEVTLRLSTKAKNEEEAQARLNAFEQDILRQDARVAEAFYGYGDDNSLAQLVVNELKEAGLSVTAAESLTAGLFQASVASVSGASQVFPGGFVTYSLAQKAQMLDIPTSDLEKHGVVSAFTAQAMAQQARAKTGTNIGVSLTGVAGPDTLEGQPVGTVYIGLATEAGVTSHLLQLGDRSRQDIREVSVLSALDSIRKYLKSLKYIV